MEDTVVDLDSILKMWAWTAYITAKGSSESQYDGVEMRVIWENVSSNVRNTEYTNGKFNTDPAAEILHEETFQNESDEIQEYPFHANGQTTATVTTTFTKPIPRGPEGFLKMDIPNELLASTSDFGTEVLLNRKEPSIKVPQIWDSDVTVKAPPGKRTTAKMRVWLKSFGCDFTSQICLKGNVRVNIVRRDTESLLMVVQNDLATVLRDIIEADEGSAQFLGVDFEGKTAFWTMSGHMEFVYGREKETEIDYEDLTV